MKLLPSSDELVPWDAGVDSSVPLPAIHDDGTMIHVTASENLFAGIKPILWKFTFFDKNKLYSRRNNAMDFKTVWLGWDIFGGVLKKTYTGGHIKDYREFQEICITPSIDIYPTYHILVDPQNLCRVLFLSNWKERLMWEVAEEGWINIPISHHILGNWKTLFGLIFQYWNKWTLCVGVSRRYTAIITALHILEGKGYS